MRLMPEAPIRDAVQTSQERDVFPSGFLVHVHACPCGWTWPCAHHALRCATVCEHCGEERA
mgnify:CR=1 FL=1